MGIVTSSTSLWSRFELYIEEQNQVCPSSQRKEILNSRLKRELEKKKQKINNISFSGSFTSCITLFRLLLPRLARQQHVL